jgi:hypothetical protein
VGFVEGDQSKKNAMAGAFSTHKETVYAYKIMA